MKNQKGITLIALIITIIVLAILAAVSITALTGQNGIVKEALQTSEDKEIADEKEQVTVAYMGAAMKNHGYGTTVDELQTELNETIGAGKTEVTEENGKLNVKFVDTGRTYVAGDVHVGDDEWSKLLADANNNPTNYKHSSQTGTEYIGIGTDGKPVNMDLWNPTYDSATDSFWLGQKDGRYGMQDVYRGSIVDGKIEGEVPQYIYSQSLDEFKPVTVMFATFASLGNLKISPKIPTTVNNMDFTFYSCYNLIEAPVIPNSVISMGGTFAICEALQTAPVIPESVENMYRYLGEGENNLLGGTFSYCSSLTGDLVINANPTAYDYCLQDVATKTGCSLKLSGSSTKLNEILATKSSTSNISLK